MTVNITKKRATIAAIITGLFMLPSFFNAAPENISTPAVVSPVETQAPVSAPVQTLKPTSEPIYTPEPTVAAVVKTTPVPTIFVRSTPTPVKAVQTGYACNCSKTCPNMNCAEAQYQLNQCGCRARDADHDGIACDAQCQ